MLVYKFLLKLASVPFQIKEELLFLQMGAGLGILVQLLVLSAHTEWASMGSISLLGTTWGNHYCFIWRYEQLFFVHSGLC